MKALLFLIVLCNIASCSTAPGHRDQSYYDSWNRRAAISGALSKIINSPPVTRVQQPTYQYNQRPQNRTPSNSLQNNQYYQQLQLINMQNQLQNNAYKGF